MTIGQLLTVWRRQWLIVLLCLAGAAGLGWHVSRPEGVYWSTTPIVIRPPYLSGYYAPLSGITIPLAGVVAGLVNRDAPEIPPSVSPDVSIVDRGLYDGWTVFVPDYGGQWGSNFTDPIIVVQASGPTPEIVSERMEMVIGRIERTLDEIQDEAGVDERWRAEAVRLQATSTVEYARGNRVRSLAGVGALSFIVLICLPPWVERIHGATWRRHSRKRVALKGQKVGSSDSLV